MPHFIIGLGLDTVTMSAIRDLARSYNPSDIPPPFSRMPDQTPKVLPLFTLKPDADRAELVIDEIRKSVEGFVAKTGRTAMGGSFGSVRPGVENGQCVLHWLSAATPELAALYDTLAWPFLGVPLNAEEEADPSKSVRFNALGYRPQFTLRPLADFQRTRPVELEREACHSWTSDRIDIVESPHPSIEHVVVMHIPFQKNAR